MSRSRKSRVLAAVAATSLLFTVLAPAPAIALERDDVPETALAPAGWKNTEWINPGGFTNRPVADFGLLPNTPTLDASAMVESYLATATGRAVLVFAPGTYYFRTSLDITRDGVILRGAGSNDTTFVIGSQTTPDAQIAFRGTRSGNPLGVVGSVSSGATQITVSNAASIGVGDLVQLYASTGRVAYGYPFESQFFTVLAKSQNTLTLDMAVGLDYDGATDTPQIQRVDPIEHVGLDRVRMIRTVMPPTDGVVASNLQLLFSRNAFVKDAESVRSDRAHIQIDWSKDVVITNNRIHDAFKNVSGDGGYSYGITANWGSTGVRISDNKLWNLRHHILLQLGANHTVVSHNSVEQPTDYNDVAFHASYAYMNLIEGNRFTESYADNSKFGQGVLNATGPKNTWFRNYATQEIGTINNETFQQTIIGNVAGAILLDNQPANAGHVIGANRVAGTTVWGALPTNADLPPSLYLAARPSAWETSRSWPVWGPDLLQGGTANRLPAQDLPRTSNGYWTDPLNDWSKTSSRSSSLELASGSADLLGGDASRASRTSTTSAQITWQVSELDAARFTTYFWPEGDLAPFIFHTSTDGVSWTPATPHIETTGGNWKRYYYTVASPEGADFIRVTFPALTPSWTAQLGGVQFITAP